MTAKEPIVKTQCGKLEGVEKNGLYVFKGIPYAAPPVGKLRWMPPQKPAKWSGVRPAKEFGAVAPQPIMPGGDAIGTPSFEGQEQSEDCLSLNIWTPGLGDAKRPVLVWIHGGAFYIGSGTEGFLEDGVLARRGDVVVVSINYRLGAYGFLNLNEVTGGKIPSTGNEGLLDQVAALEWVQENIAAFGGDPNNITASGFSAGAMSTGCLLGMPSAKGKFHKAMNRSGAANVVSTLEGSVNIARMQLEVWGLKASDIDGIRKLSTAQILEAQNKLIGKMRETGRATPYQPVMDGKIIPEMPIHAIRKGLSKHVPTMAGSSLDELKMMMAMNPDAAKMDEAELAKRLKAVFPADMVPVLIKTYNQALTKRGDKVTPAGIMGSINTDSFFRIPTIRMLEAQQDNGAPAYNYIFTYKCPAMGGIMGAMHGLDNPFLYGALVPEFTGKDEELEALAVKIQDSTAAFLKTGDPSCKSAGKWPVYGKDRMTMVWDRKSGIQAAPYEPERAVWDKYDITNSMAI